MGYLANYGYTDGSGDWYIALDGGKCDGCGKCVPACPQGLFEVITDDYDDLVAVVKEEFRKKIKYACGPCKAGARPCVLACAPGAISHSW